MRWSESWPQLASLAGVSATHRYIFDLHPDTDVYWCMADIGWVTGHSYIVYGPLSNATTGIIYEGAIDFPDKDRWAQIAESAQARANLLHDVALQIVAAPRLSRVPVPQSLEEPRDAPGALLVRSDAHVAAALVHVAEEAAAGGAHDQAHARHRHQLLLDRAHDLVHRVQARALRRGHVPTDALRLAGGDARLAAFAEGLGAWAAGDDPDAEAERAHPLEVALDAEPNLR